MATTTLSFDKTAANGLLKTVYGKDVIDLSVDAALLQNKLKIDDKYAFVGGDHYEVPVVVRLPSGHSFNGAGGGAVQLNDPRAGKTVPASVSPYEYILRESVPFAMLDKGKNGGEAAFVSTMAQEGAMMATAARTTLELQALHGQQGLATVTGAIAGEVITIDVASLSPGILSFLEGQKVDVYQSNLSTLRRGALVISAVDVDAGTITFDGSATSTNITTGDVVFMFGANASGTFGEQIGLGKQLAGDNGAGSTGTYFGINKATYSKWRASVMTLAGEPSLSTFVKAAVKAQDRGFTSGELTAIVAPRCWGTLNSALQAAEVFQGYSMTKKTGTNEIEIQNGAVKITILAHPLQKQGQAYVVPTKNLKRIGATDLTFTRAGGGEEFLRDVPDYNCMERQCRASWQLFNEAPCHSVLITGLTYSA